MGKTLFVEQCYNELKNAQTSYDIFQFLKSLSEEFGFDKFSTLVLPSEHSDHLSPNFIITNWPPALIRAYDELGLLQNSPVIARLRSSEEPVEWELEAINQHRTEQEVTASVRLFKEFDMLGGIYFPTYDPQGKRGAISFSGTRGKLLSKELATLHLVSLYAYNQISTITSSTSTYEHKMTSRELECLHWSSKGKTNAEIGIILSISENTVSSYMGSAMQKLNATNKSHVVAQALRHGLIN